MKTGSIFILFFFMTIPLFGRQTWTFQDSLHIYKVQLDSFTTQGFTPQKKLGVFQIDIINRNQLIQSISIEEPFLHNSFLDSNTIFVVEDMNFDGYNDFRLLNWTSIRIDKTYQYWFYSPNQQQFTKDISLNSLANPVFNHEYKTVYTQLRIGSSEFEQALYHFENNKLLLLVEQFESWSFEHECNFVSLKVFVKDKYIQEEKRITDFMAGTYSDKALIKVLQSYSR